MKRMLTVDVISTIELSPHVSSLSTILERDIATAFRTSQIQRQIFKYGLTLLLLIQNH